MDKKKSDIFLMDRFLLKYTQRSKKQERPLGREQYIYALSIAQLLKNNYFELQAFRVACES